MYNRIKLYIKFRQLESRLLKQGKTADYHIKDATKKQVLIIDDKIPEYDKDSGSRRLTKIIKLLLRNGYGVSLLANMKEYKYLTEYVAYFREMGVNVYEPAVDDKGDLITKEKFIQTIAKDLSYAWLHRPGIFTKYYPLIKKYNSALPVIFDMVDFHYLRMKREAELSNDPLKDKIADKHLKEELKNSRLADNIIVISESDKQELLKFYSDSSKMTVIGNLHQHKGKTDGFKPFADRDGLLFIGGFAHKPNEDAVLFLYNEIMPLVWQKRPDIKVNIVGSNPPESVLALSSDKFTVTGYVKDISEYFYNARLFVAPLRYGAGIKGKIGQSLEYSLPLVTTAVGAEGFDFSKFTEAMTAETAADTAEKIIKLYEDEALWKDISAFTEAIIEPYSERTVEKGILDVIKA